MNVNFPWGNYQPLVSRQILFKYVISIENRVNASVCRDIWAQVMFIKFSNLHDPLASAI